MPDYRGYVLLGARYGHTFEREDDEYGWLVYAPDGRLVGDRHTLTAAKELVDSDLRQRDGDGLEG